MIGNHDAQNGRLIVNGSTQVNGDVGIGRVHVNSRTGVVSGVGEGTIGPNSTDAVNGAQIYRERKALHRGIANAAALAALHPASSDEDSQWSLAAGLGHYKGEQALAVGAFWQPRDDFLISLGASMAKKSYAVNAGITYKLGGSRHRLQSDSAAKVIRAERQMTSLEAQNRALYLQNQQMRRQTALIRNENEELKARLEALEQRMTAMEAPRVARANRAGRRPVRTVRTQARNVAAR